MTGRELCRRIQEGGLMDLEVFISPLRSYPVLRLDGEEVEEYKRIPDTDKRIPIEEVAMIRLMLEPGEPAIVALGFQIPIVKLPVMASSQVH